MASLVAFYGDPNDDDFERDNLVTVTPPWKLFYAGKPWNHGIKVHKKCSVQFQSVLTEIWDHYSRDQHNIDAVGMSNFDGSYNNRDVRGRPGVKSVHAFGAAFDFDAAHNQLGVSRGAMPVFVANAFKKQGAVWGGDYHGRKDWMHFQFACEGAAAPLVADGDDSEYPVPPEPTGDEPATPVIAAAEEAKPIYKSKIAMSAGAVGLSEAADTGMQINDALNTASGIKDSVKHLGIIDLFFNVLDKHPRIIVSLFIVGVCVAVGYWRWRDHGKGQK